MGPSPFRRPAAVIAPSVPEEELPPPASYQVYTQYVTDTIQKLRYLQLWLDDPDAALAMDPRAYDKLEKEVVIEGARTYRRHKVAGVGKAVHLEANPGDPRSALLVPLFEVLHARLKRFDTARLNLADAFFVGMTVACVEGDHFDALLPGDTRVRRWWFPLYVRDVDKRRVRQEFDPTTRRERWTIYDFRRNLWVQITPQIAWHYLFHRYDTKERSLNYGVGLAQRLVYYWTVKTVAFETMVRGAERWGYGWVIAKMSGLLAGASTTNLDTYVAKINAIISNLEKQREKHFFVHDKEALELDVKEPSGTGGQIVRDIVDYCDDQVRILLLGSILPTGGGGDVGSNARAREESDSSEAIFAYDRSVLAESLGGLIEATRRCNAEHLAALGYAHILSPVYSLQQQKTIDHGERAKDAQVVSGLGVPLSKREVYEQTGFTPPDPNDPQDALAPHAAPASPSGGLVGAGPPPGALVRSEPSPRRFRAGEEVDVYEEADA